MNKTEKKQIQTDPLHTYIENIVELKINEKFSIINFPQIQAPLAATPNRIDIIQASELTRYKVTTLYTMVNKKKIPYHKKYGMLFFYRDELEAWLTSES